MIWLLINRYGSVIANLDHEPSDEERESWKFDYPDVEWQQFKKVTRRVKKPAAPELPAEVWTIACHGHTMVGSYSSVSYGEKFFATAEEAQTDIDGWSPWPGMGPREKYRPHRLVNPLKKV